MTTTFTYTTGCAWYSFGYSTTLENIESNPSLSSNDAFFYH